MPKKRALLIGGTGAIGTYLAPELVSRGYLVDITSRSSRKPDHTGVRYIQGDGHDVGFITNTLKKMSYDVIVDFMIYSTQEFRGCYETLLENCTQYIFLSSYRVFADTDVITESSPRLLDVSEDKEFLKTDEYALAKARQEDILRGSHKKNWTIVRPSITYSRDRYQFGTFETDVVVWRALHYLPVPLPRVIGDKLATMTWAGDTARIISKLALNSRAYTEDFNISTTEHHTWTEVGEIYREKIGLQVVPAEIDEYVEAKGGKEYERYLIMYNRMYDRVIDNSKVLSVTDESQDGFISLREGLHKELDIFLKNPTFRGIDYAQHARIDKLTNVMSPTDSMNEEEARLYMETRFPLRTKLSRLRSKIRLRTRVKSSISRVKMKVRVRTRLKGLVRWLKNRRYRRVDGAILTLSGYYNYGNILQRFAMQRFLKNNGLDFVSYWNEQNHGRSDTEEQLEFTKNFVNRHIVCKPYDPKDNFPAYIVGSDQIWRNWGYDDPKKDLGYYFLDFTKARDVRRVAYAASIGQESLEDALIDDETATYIAPFVRKFDSIGMRESSGVALAKREWGVDAVEVIDPTMLVSREEYSKLIDECSYELPDLDGTIFTYFILSNGSKRMVVDNIIKNKGLKEHSIYLDDKDILPPVELWLKSIRDASFVVADSFHGIVFSIIFNTPFIVVESGTGGVARIKTLLAKFGLSDRYITSDQVAKYDVDDLYNIDWDRVNATLQKLQKQDGGWLLDAIKGKDRV